MTDTDTTKPKPTFEITIARQYDMEILADTIITAVEGGIGYWSECISYTHTEGPEHTRADIQVVSELKDDDMADVYHLDCEVARKGIERILRAGGNLEDECHVGSEIRGYIQMSLDDNSAYMIDATAADCIIQAGIFNSILFG